MSKTISIPQDLEAEQICIGASLTHGHSLELVLDRLDDQHFYDPRHKIIVSYLKKFYLSGDNPRFTDLVRALGKDNLLADAGGSQYIKGIEVSTRHAEIKYYIDQLEETCSQRQFLLLANKMLSAKGKSTELIQEATDELATIGVSQKNPPRCMTDHLNDFRDGQSFFEHFEKRMQDKREGKSALTGIPTGWRSLDLMLNGLEKRELIILGARPSMGKTEVAVQALYSMCSRGIKVMFFSLEMSATQILNRMIGICTGIHSSRILRLDLTQEEVERIKAARPLIEKVTNNLWIDEVANSPAAGIRARLKREVAANGIELCMVDHLSKIASPTAGLLEYQKITENVGAMKALAQECNVPLILCAQLRRLNEGEKVTPPDMHHLRDSGAVEQDADKILLIHRPDYYDEYSHPGKVIILVRKNREGERSHVDFFYDVKTQRFAEVDYNVEDRVEEVVNEPAEPFFTPGKGSD